MSLSAPSYVSPTTGSDQNTESRAWARAAWATSASRTTPTEWVLVIPMTPPSSPDSRTHSRPVSSPLPLSRWQPANTGSVQTSSSCGTTTVTPVRTGPSPTTSGPSPLISVVWPDPDARHVRDRVVLPRFEQADAQAQRSSTHSPPSAPRCRDLRDRSYHRRVSSIPEARPAPRRLAVRLPLPSLDGVAPMDAAEAFRDLPGLALLESARPGPHRPLELPDRRPDRGARGARGGRGPVRRGPVAAGADGRR